MTIAALALPSSLATSTSGGLLATNTLWFMTRGAGITTLLLLTASVLLGILSSLDLGPRGLPRFVTPELHRNISLLSLVFLAIHVTTTIVDGYVPIRWIDAFVPFIGSYHPLALGLGAVALDLMVAINLTSVFRHRLKPTTWRYVHLSAYACWPIALFHGLLIGTDRTQGWMLLLEAACALPVAALVVYRSLRRRPRVGGRLESTVPDVRSPTPAGMHRGSRR